MSSYKASDQSEKAQEENPKIQQDDLIDADRFDDKYLNVEAEYVDQDEDDDQIKEKSQKDGKEELVGK